MFVGIVTIAVPVVPEQPVIVFVIVTVYIPPELIIGFAVVPPETMPEPDHKIV